MGSPGTRRTAADEARIKPSRPRRVAWRLDAYHHHHLISPQPAPLIALISPSSRPPTTMAPVKVTKICCSASQYLQGVENMELTKCASQSALAMSVSASPGRELNSALKRRRWSDVRRHRAEVPPHPRHHRRPQPGAYRCVEQRQPTHLRARAGGSRQEGARPQPLLLHRRRQGYP